MEGDLPGFVSLLYHSDGGSAAASHVQRGRDVCKFMEEFWKRYIVIEQAYARSLAALVDHSCASFQPDGFFARMFAPALEECGELADAWAALRLSMRETAAAHQTIAESVAREVSQPISHYLDSTEIELRQVTDMGKSQKQELLVHKKTVKTMAKQVAKLHVQCAKLKKQSQNLTMAYDKRQKVDLALSTSQAELKLLEENYKREVQAVRKMQQSLYLNKMPGALVSLQQLEERRIDVVQQSLYKYVAVFQASIPASRAAVEAVAYATERVSQRKLIHDFVKGTMMARPEAKPPTAPRYVAFGELEPSEEVVDEEVDDVLESDMQARQFMFDRMEKELLAEAQEAAQMAAGGSRRRRNRSQSSRSNSAISAPRRGRSASTKARKELAADEEAPAEKQKQPAAEAAPPASAPAAEAAAAPAGEAAANAAAKAAAAHAPAEAQGKAPAEETGEAEGDPSTAPAHTVAAKVAASALHQSKSEATLARKRGSKTVAVDEQPRSAMPLSFSTGSVKPKEASIGWIDDILGGTPAPAPKATAAPAPAEKTTQKKKKKKNKAPLPSVDFLDGLPPASAPADTEKDLEQERLEKERQQRKQERKKAVQEKQDRLHARAQEGHTPGGPAAETEALLEQQRAEDERQKRKEQKKKELKEKKERQRAEQERRRQEKEKLQAAAEEEAADAAAAAAAGAAAAAAKEKQRQEEAKKAKEAKKEAAVPELSAEAARMLAELENAVEQNDYYKLFEVEPTADLRVITRMRRELHKRYHPDNFSGNAAAKSVAIANMMTINEVFTNVFKNPQARELYDKLCLYRAEYANLLRTADPMLQRAVTNLSILGKALRKANMPAALNTEVQQVLLLVKKSRGISP